VLPRIEMPSVATSTGSSLERSRWRGGRCCVGRAEVGGRCSQIDCGSQGIRKINSVRFQFAIPQLSQCSAPSIAADAVLLYFYGEHRGHADQIHGMNEASL